MDTNIAPKTPKLPSTVPIRIKRSTAKHLSQLLTQLNKKPLGRKVMLDDILAKALACLRENHLDEIKSQTYSSEDRLEIEFKNYCKANGPITKNQFLERILSAALGSFQQKPKAEENKNE